MVTSTPPVTGDTEGTALPVGRAQTQKVSRARWGAALSYLLSCACAGDSDHNASDATEFDVTYAQDVAPIVQARCAACHVEGGIGGFSLSSYEAAKTWGDFASMAIEGHQMPPFPPAQGSCAEISDARFMPPDEVERFGDWVAAGMPEGNPDMPPAYEIDLPGDELELPTHRFEMSAGYLPPVEVFEEYRCFRVDPGLSESLRVAALHVASDTPERFHQAHVSLLPPERVAEAMALEGVDGRPGWPCYFNPGLDGLTPVGDMMPGRPLTALPEGGALELEAGTQFVVDGYLHHYEYEALDLAVAAWAHAEDTSPEVRFMTLSNTELSIPAGADSHVETVEAQVETQSRVWSVDVHMHQWGRSIHVEVARVDGTHDCLLDIPRWDPEWQGSYRLAAPKVLAPGDQVVLRCEWANEQADQPLVNGVQIEAQDLSWGLDELHEMCELRLLLTD